MNVDGLDLGAYPINAHVYVHMHCMHKPDPKLIVGGVGIMYIQSRPGTAHNWLMVQL